MSYITKISVDGGNAMPIGSSLYGTCTTLSNIAAKTVICPDFDSLVVGVTIRVKFTYHNAIENPTLNVNSTGALPIYQNGITRVGADEGSSWKAGAIVAFTYDGNGWLMNGSALPALSNVATSGSYNDLINKPSIPTKTSDLTNDSDFATHTDVNQAFAANDAMVFKGTLGSSGTVQSLPAVHEVGWTYKVANAGTYAGQLCEVGDLVICIADGTVATSLDWTVVQANINFFTKANTYNGVYTIYATNISSGHWICERDQSYGYVDVFEQGTTILCYLNSSNGFAGGSEVTIDIQGLTFEYGGGMYINGAPVYKNGSPFTEACPQGSILMLHVHGPKLEVIAQTKLPESVKLDQGSANSGKLLYVNSNGTVVPATLTVANETLQII